MSGHHGRATSRGRNRNAERLTARRNRARTTKTLRRGLGGGRSGNRRGKATFGGSYARAATRPLTPITTASTAKTSRTPAMFTKCSRFSGSRSVGDRRSPMEWPVSENMGHLARPQ